MSILFKTSRGYFRDDLDKSLGIDRKILGPQSWREVPAFWWEGVKFWWEMRTKAKEGYK
jgi:hypothetical protein